MDDEATAAEIGNTRVSREGTNIRSARKHEIRHQEHSVSCSGTPREIFRKLDDKSDEDPKINRDAVIEQYALFFIATLHRVRGIHE